VLRQRRRRRQIRGHEPAISESASSGSEQGNDKGQPRGCPLLIELSDTPGRARTFNVLLGRFLPPLMRTLAMAVGANDIALCNFNCQLFLREKNQSPYMVYLVHSLAMVKVHDVRGILNTTILAWFGLCLLENFFQALTLSFVTLVISSLVLLIVFPAVFPLTLFTELLDSPDPLRPEERSIKDALTWAATRFLHVRILSLGT
jgi:hypothetical protein